MNRTGWQSWNTGGRDTTQGLSGEVLVRQVPRRPFSRYPWPEEHVACSLCPRLLLHQGLQ